MRKRILLIVMLALLLASGVEARKIRPLTGFGLSAEAGYWSHAGGSAYFDMGIQGGLRVCYRFEPGDLELFGFFDFTYILPKDGGALGEDETATLLTFGVCPRVSFLPDNWISPFVSAGPAFQLRQTSLGLSDPGDDTFSYTYDAANFAAVAELGAEFPFPPHSLAEVGVRLHHIFAEEGQGFAGLSFFAGYAYYF